MSVLVPPQPTRNIGIAYIAGKPVQVLADPSWYRFLTQALIDRIGGTNGLSTAELEALITAAQNDADAAALAAANAQDAADDAQNTATAAGVAAAAAQVSANAAQDDATDAQTRVGVLETEIDVLSDVLQTVYVPQWDQIDASTAYFGQALPGTATSAASWRIIKYTFSGDDFLGQYADGDASFNNIWDNRASLSYS